MNSVLTSRALWSWKPSGSPCRTTDGSTVMMSPPNSNSDKMFLLHLSNNTHFVLLPRWTCHCHNTSKRADLRLPKQRPSFKYAPKSQTDRRPQQTDSASKLMNCMERRHPKCT